MGIFLETQLPFLILCMSVTCKLYSGSFDYGVVQILGPVIIVWRMFMLFLFLGSPIIYLFIEVYLIYDNILVLCVQHSDLKFMYVMRYHDNYSYHLLYKVIIVLLTIFLMLYFTSPWYIYFITESLCFLIPFIYLASHPSCLWQNHQFVLCAYEPFLFCFVCSFII